MDTRWLWKASEAPLQWGALTHKCRRGATLTKYIVCTLCGMHGTVANRVPTVRQSVEFEAILEIPAESEG